MTAGPDYTQGEDLEAAIPSARLCAILDRMSGPLRDYARLSDDELVTVIGRWAATESWAAAAKLSAVAALVRRRGITGTGTCGSAAMPRAWQETVNEEVELALSASAHAVDTLIDVSWQLAARLPHTAAALASGQIDQYKAQIVAQTLAVLDDAAATAADADLAGRLAGKTPGEIRRMAGRAAVTADPEAAVKRREKAQRDDARVSLWREPAGTAALAASGLPPDDALAAEQAVQDRATAYKKAGVTGSMDQLRARAFVDALTEAGARATGTGPGKGTRPVSARINLTVPLRTLLGLADIPAQAASWGVIDPALARDLISRAIAGAGTEWHLTVTEDRGWAIGHGCETTNLRTKRNKNGNLGSKDSHGAPASGLGTWRMTTPDGKTVVFPILPVPVTGCDHSYASSRHDPTAVLRHLVEIRDRTCTFPGCGRPAARCDFEHALAFDKGGMTCACNCGARCRRHHRVKQAKDWSVAQPLPGFHVWTTPAGRTYTREPARYAA